MNGIKYLLDTCFILEFHKQNKEVLQLITCKNIHLSECAISVINRLEVLGYNKITDDDAKNLSDLLSAFTKLPLNLAIENKVIELRKHYQIKLPDAIILATSLVNQVELLSLDNSLMNKYQQQILIEKL